MEFQLPDLLPALPEMFILGMACFALLVDLFLGHRFRSLSYIIVQFALLSVIVMHANSFTGEKIVAFHGLFITDPLARLLKIVISLCAFAAFIYSRYYVVDRDMARGEYYILGLFSTLGMMILVSAHSMLTIYLGLELMALPIYAMVALQKDSARASEAAIKYFVMGAIASGMMLYGMSMIYGVTGSLDLADIAKVISTLPKHDLLLIFSLVFILVGLGFKFAAAPFHMWAPDVYSGAPTSVTLFLSTAPKLAALGMMVRLLLLALPQLHVQWQQVLMVMSILSMGLGNLLAIAQTNMKRMLAYSAIAQIGYMLLGFVAGTQAGFTASLFYIISYALMSLAAFGMLVLLSRAGFEAENIEDLTGLNSQNPWFALLVMITMFSMAGVPPTVGFFAKFFVLKELVNVNLVWLATLALGFAIVGAFYYIRIIKTMYFDEAKTPLQIVCSRDMQLVISVNAVALFALGLFPGALLHLCTLAFA